MLRAALGAALATLLAACAGTAPDMPSGRVDIQIDQLNQVPLAAQRVTGGAPMQYRVRVANRTPDVVTLQSVNVQSVAGTDAYVVQNTTRGFDVKIPASEFGDVEFWAPAQLTGNTVMGANGPVTLRLTLVFDSPSGKFNETVIRQVNTGRSSTRDNQ
jgi:hypothetical protein